LPDKRIYGGPGEGYKFLGGPNNFLVGELSLLYVSDSYTDDAKKSYQADVLSVSALTFQLPSNLSLE
jgi:hypothetical protein